MSKRKEFQKGADRLKPLAGTCTRRNALPPAGRGPTQRDVRQVTLGNMAGRLVGITARQAARDPLRGRALRGFTPAKGPSESPR